VVNRALCHAGIWGLALWPASGFCAPEENFAPGFAALADVLGGVDQQAVLAHVATGPVQTSLLYLDVVVNGVGLGENLLFARRGETIYATPDVIARLRLVRGDAPAILFRGRSFLPLAAMPGVWAVLDEGAQALRVNAPSTSFAPSAQAVGMEPVGLTPTPQAFSAFLNYSVNLTAQSDLTGTGYVEGGVSQDWGMATTTATLTSARMGQPFRATRLESYVLRDDAASMTRMVLGDTITAPSLWAGQARFGGLRIGSEFSLRPGLITFPTPQINSSGTLPSQVDILVNNATRSSVQVAPGPFTLSNLPVVTGAGQVTLQIRDVLGVERQVTTAYYASPQLLRAGLAQWSFEAGAARRGFGVENFAYGAGFVAGEYRRALGEGSTTGLRAYFSTENRAIGLEHALVLGQLGELGGAVAASSGLQGEGTRYRVFIGRTSPLWAFSASYERSSAHFVPQMIDPAYTPALSQFQSSLGLSLGRWGALGASYTAQSQGDGVMARVVSGNYSASLARAGTISAFAMLAEGAGMHDLRVGASWTLALGLRGSVSVRGDSDGAAMEWRGSPPAGPGWGYRFNVERGRREMALGSVQWRGAVGDADLQVAQAQGQSAARLLANGSLIWSNGQWRATRAMGDGFALVRVPGQANVRVYRENQEVGRTGADGTLLVTGLMPYQANRIGIAASDLPITSALEDTSQTVVPRMRGAALVQFRSEIAPSARMRVMLADGTPLAAGTSLTAGKGLMAGQGDGDMFVGYGGEVFIAQFNPGGRLYAQTPAGVCVVNLPSDAVGPTMRLGPQVCQLQGEGSYGAFPGFITAML